VWKIDAQLSSSLTFDDFRKGAFGWDFCATWKFEMSSVVRAEFSKNPDIGGGAPRVNSSSLPVIATPKSNCFVTAATLEY
jgi:hypothetical protein